MPGVPMFLLLAVGLAWEPRRWADAVGLAAAVILPWWITVPVLAGLAVRRMMRRADPQEEVAFLQAVAAELRAGRSLRHALVRGCDRAPGLDLAQMTRMAEAGRPMEEVAAAAARGLPGTGRLAEAAVRIGAECGGMVAPVFTTLAGIQADRIELGREAASATAAARASMMVLAAIPLGGLAVTLASGRWAALFALGGPGLALAGMGTALLLAGAGCVLWLGRGAGR